MYHRHRSCLATVPKTCCHPAYSPERSSTETQKISTMVDYLTKTQFSPQHLKRTRHDYVDNHYIECTTQQNVTRSMNKEAKLSNTYIRDTSEDLQHPQKPRVPIDIVDIAHPQHRASRLVDPVHQLFVLTGAKKRRPHWPIQYKSWKY